MYPLRRIGYNRGLKNIEKELGISISEETKDITGFDAVRLWKQYKRGDIDALEKLVKYYPLETAKALTMCLVQFMSSVLLIVGQSLILRYPLRSKTSKSS